ncbi:MAG: tmRNA-binding protein [Rickettsiaceae bacterium]|jgi:outer membrane protein assembly factor BamE (lipoprotein component of BamABCDE complex)|nr:tmRNA-binding protein [Rickettsiaceae bacterium]
MKFKFLNYISILALLSLASCKSVDVTGNNVKEADINYLQINKPTKDQVVDRLGTPTIMPDYSPNTWYYVYIKTAKTTWTFPSITEQKVLKVTFDNVGRVDKAILMENIHNNNVAITAHTTPTPGNEGSAIQEFVKNIGKFNKPKKKK